MLYEELGGPIKKALTANSVASAYTTKNGTRTRPSGTGIIDLGYGVNRAGILLIPYGLGVNNDTMLFQVVGWEILEQPDPAATVYVPRTLAQFTATLGQRTGVALGNLLATELMADTIALVTGTNADFADVTSPVDDTVASARVFTQGCPIIQIEPIIGTTPTSVNVLYRLF